MTDQIRIYDLIRVEENRKVFYLIPLGKFSDRVGNLDITDLVRNAIKRDIKAGYDVEQGPNFAIEVDRATAYAGYVQSHASAENLHKFSTRQFDHGGYGYSCFLNAEARKPVEKKPTEKRPAKPRKKPEAKAE